MSRTKKDITKIYQEFHDEKKGGFEDVSFIISSLNFLRVNTFLK